MAKEENIDKLKEMANQLIQVEEEVIDLTEKTINQAENPTVKYLLRAIQLFRETCRFWSGSLGDPRVQGNCGGGGKTRSLGSIEQT